MSEPDTATSPDARGLQHAWIALAVGHAVAGGLGQALDLFWETGLIALSVLGTFWIPYLGFIAVIFGALYGSLGVLYNLAQLGLHLTVSLVALLTAASLPGRSPERTWVLAGVVAAMSAAAALVGALPGWIGAGALALHLEPTAFAALAAAVVSGWELWLLAFLWSCLAAGTWWIGRAAPDLRFEDAQGAWLGYLAAATATMAGAGGLVSAIAPLGAVALLAVGAGSWELAVGLFLLWALPLAIQAAVALTCAAGALVDRPRVRTAALFGVVVGLPLVLGFQLIRLAPLAAVALSPALVLAAAALRAVDVRWRA